MPLSSFMRVAEQIPGRTDTQCLHRWQKVLNPGVYKGPWTPEVGSSSAAACGQRLHSCFTPHMQSRFEPDCGADAVL